MPQFEVRQDLRKSSAPAPLASATQDSLLGDAWDPRQDRKRQHYQVDRGKATGPLTKRPPSPPIERDLDDQQPGKGGLGANAPWTPPTLYVAPSIALPLSDRQQSEIRRAEADFETQDAPRARIEADHPRRRRAFAAFLASREKVERTRSRLLGHAKRTRDPVGIRCRAGAASLREFLYPLCTYRATTSSTFDDLTEHGTAVFFQRELAVGRELR